MEQGAMRRHAGLGVAIIFIVAAAFTVSHDRVDFSFLIFLCPRTESSVLHTATDTTVKGLLRTNNFDTHPRSFSPFMFQFKQPTVMSTSDIVVQEPECHWAYTGEHGPADWGAMCQDKYPLCSNGTTQSPIDVTTWNVVTYTQKFLQLERWSPETLSWYISCLYKHAFCLHAIQAFTQNTHTSHLFLLMSLILTQPRLGII